MPASSTRTFTQTGSVPEVLAALRALQVRDDNVESEAKRCGSIAHKWRVGFWGAAVLAFASLFMSIDIPRIGIPLVIIAVIGVIVCIGFDVKWSSLRRRYERQDVEDRRTALAIRFLEVIGQDVPAKANCAIEINFDGYQQHGRLVSRRRRGFWFLRPTWLLKYEDSWFSASGRLYDGNCFKVGVQQIVHRKERRKRKYTKAQERISEKVTLVLRVAPASYPNWQQLAQTLQPGTSDGLQVLRADVRESVLRVVGVTPECVKRFGRMGSSRVVGEWNLATGHTLLRLFIFVYDKLQHCRPEPGRPASEGTA